MWQQRIEAAFREGYDFGQADRGWHVTDADGAWAKSDTRQNAVDALPPEPASGWPYQAAANLRARASNLRTRGQLGDRAKADFLDDIAANIWMPVALPPEPEVRDRNPRIEDESLPAEPDAKDAIPPGPDGATAKPRCKGCDLGWPKAPTVGGERVWHFDPTSTTAIQCVLEPDASPVKPVCQICGQPATCFGAYESPDATPAYACDSCCGHGNEDGRCSPIQLRCGHCGDGGVIPTSGGSVCATCYHPLGADASPVKEPNS